MNTKNNGCLVALIALALLPVASIWRGWFMVSTFGLPQLSIPAAIGLSTMVSIFMPFPRSDDEDKTTEEIVTIMIAKAALVPACLLGFGKVVTFFM